MFKKPNFNLTGTYIQISGENQSGTLHCPKFTSPVKSGRAFHMNVNVAGGQSTKTLPAGAYGVLVEPPTLVDPSYTKYYLGTKLTKFRSPATKFMIIEGERATDYANAKYPYNDLYSTWHPGDDPGYPGWSGEGGIYAFRHSNYRRANFLFIDGHVESLTPKDEINTRRRFLPEW